MLFKKFIVKALFLRRYYDLSNNVTCRINQAGRDETGRGDLMILLVVLFVAILIGTLAACKAAALADEQMERSFRDWLEQRPERKREFEKG